MAWPGNEGRSPVRRIVMDALLAAVALTIFVVELQIPMPVPVPGMKLGLANIVTVAALFWLTPWDAGLILLARILLGCFLTGRVMALIYSLAGGLLCYLAMLVMRRIVTPRQIWVCSVIGALMHNVGQMAAALLVTGTWALLAYLPVLLAIGIFTGLFTGLAAQFLVARLKNLKL